MEAPQLSEKTKLYNPYITEGNLEPSQQEDFEIPTYLVPFDDEGYVQAFAHDEDQQILDFFDKFGFVVIKDVLTEQGTLPFLLITIIDCQESIKDVWKFINSLCGATRHSKDPLNDWNGWSVCSKLCSFDNLKGLLASKGMVGEDSLFSSQFIKNRVNPKVHSVFSLLLGKKELVCNHDRCGFFRPTIWNVNGSPLASKL